MIDESSSVPGILPTSTEASRARGTALRLLAVRSRSVVEIQERLGRRFPRDTVEQTVARLIADGLLNDDDFAQQWRQSRERNKPRSRRKIEQELKQRGVSDDVIDGVLEDYDSLDAAYRSVARYAARQNRAVFDRRVAAFLSRRGFEPDVVRQTLRRLREELGVGSPATNEAPDDWSKMD
jgi:regulatory protein